jgi:hypothetical protein
LSLRIFLQSSNFIPAALMIRANFSMSDLIVAENAALRHPVRFSDGHAEA